MSEINLTVTDLQRIERETALELSHLDPAPTLDSLKAQGYRESKRHTA
jgi:hypothetical protein